MHLRTLSLLMLSAVFVAVPASGQIELEVAFPSLSFNRPVDLQHAGDGSGRLFVVEQAGLIRVFENARTADSAPVFLDLTGPVSDADNEEGLLGLAFHPNYASNGFFYVDYTAANPRRTVVARYQVRADNPDQADPNSGTVLMEIAQPFGNHNGGQIAFGPDGYLYIAMGDGGSAGDPQGHGQNRATLLGALLRIDADNPDPGRNYGIPSDNPHVGNTSGYREEIYAYGFRNPWRFSFDFATGRLWLGDVGQSTWEEIDLVEKGGNYGWKIMEGNHCYPPGSSCNTTGLIPPIWEYNHNLTASRRASVTGGYVYRGRNAPQLDGAYIYADFETGHIWALRYDGVNPPQNTELRDTNLLISSFGVDEQGELYLCTFSGSIYWFKPTGTQVAGAAMVPTSPVLVQNYPNPFNPATTIAYSLPRAATVEICIFTTHGQWLKTVINAQQAAGRHAVQWDGRDHAGVPQASGVYFYRLKIGDELVQARRMLLLR